MKTKALIRVSEMILLAVAVSLAMLGLVYALHIYFPTQTLASIGWNG